MSSQSTPDATRLSLLARARQRDSGAWRELVDLYSPLLTHWCQHCGLDEHSVADCVQEVFAAVATSLATYRPGTESGTFRSWLWKVARNKVRDQLRKNARQPRGVGGDTALEQMNNVPEDSLITEDEPSDAEQISRLLERGLRQVEAEFEVRSWQAFWRSTIDGVPTAVVAEELGLTSAAVRQNRSRILRRLKQQLGDVE